MEDKPNITDSDGRVWMWKPELGYMLQTSRDRYRERKRKARGKTSSNWFRTTLLKATGNICYLCGNILDPSNMTIDHVVPRAKNGVDRHNRAPACAKCNVKKADRLPTACERLWLILINAVIEKEIDS